MIGIDVGGANLKVVDDDGLHIHYCPLWEGSSLKECLERYDSEREAAVVMSGELADCFSNKIGGIRYIVDTVSSVFPISRFYGIDGLFHDGAVLELAAANWLVMADALKDTYPDSLLVDMGSTTTDLIPLNAFDEMVGQTDFSRLAQGYLQYLGLLRTPLPSLVREVNIRGERMPISSEYFACAGDAHVALSMIPPDLYTTATPDKKSPGKEDCMRRLARVVCSDLEEIGEHGARSIAESYVQKEKQLITNAVSDLYSWFNCTDVLAVGIGSDLITMWSGAKKLSEDMRDYEDALPAWAVREMAEKEI